MRTVCVQRVSKGLFIRTLRWKHAVHSLPACHVFHNLDYYLFFYGWTVRRLCVTGTNLGQRKHSEFGTCALLVPTGNWDVTITAMSILLLREGNFQVLVILKWEMDYVDFCFLPNKCYHVIPSSCSKLLMNFQTEILSFTCINTHYTSLILTEALFATKWDM